MPLPRLAAFALMVLIILGAAGWLLTRKEAVVSNSVTLLFRAEIEGTPLVFDQYAYDNPGGQGEFRVRDFRFYLSNVKLHGPGLTHAVPESYHLARFDNSASTYTLRLDNVPLEELTKVAFSVGVDTAANASIEIRGDLDPNSQMAWNWEVGYKFVVLEGTFRVTDNEYPIVFHVGFPSNRRAFEFDLPVTLLLREEPEIALLVDPVTLLNGPNKIDLAILRSVKFDRQDAKKIADNYSGMITLPPE